MTANTSTPTRFDWPKEVMAFAAKHGVEHLLPQLLEMTKRLFPSARRIEVVLEEDAELADWHSIVFAVTVTGLNVPDAAELRHQWTREMLQCYSSPRSCPFVLGLDWVT